MLNYSNAEQLSVRKSFILLPSPSQKTSFRSKQEEKKRILISFASSVPEYKPTEKAYFCRLNAVSLDRLSVKKINKNNLRLQYVTESLPPLQEYSQTWPRFLRILNEI